MQPFLLSADLHIDSVVIVTTIQADGKEISGARMLVVDLDGH